MVITPPCALLHVEIGLYGAPGRLPAIPCTPVQARCTENKIHGLRPAALGARVADLGGPGGHGRKRPCGAARATETMMVAGTGWPPPPRHQLPQLLQRLGPAHLDAAALS